MKKTLIAVSVATFLSLNATATVTVYKDDANTLKLSGKARAYFSKQSNERLDMNYVDGNVTADASHKFNDDFSLFGRVQVRTNNFADKFKPYTKYLYLGAKIKNVGMIRVGRQSLVGNYLGNADRSNWFSGVGQMVPWFSAKAVHYYSEKIGDFNLGADYVLPTNKSGRGHNVGLFWTHKFSDDFDLTAQLGYGHQSLKKDQKVYYPNYDVYQAKESSRRETVTATLSGNYKKVFLGVDTTMVKIKGQDKAYGVTLGTQFNFTDKFDWYIQTAWARHVDTKTNKNVYYRQTGTGVDYVLGKNVSTYFEVATSRKTGKDRVNGAYTGLVVNF